ncbi:MAG: PilN domain-containing protein [Nitrospinae bacterium]|nr:PilN domain-containing protein [Nitrospinota bacterium]
MIRINLLADRHAKDRLLIQQQLVMGLMIIAGAFVLCGFWWQAKASQITDTSEKIESSKKELETQKKIREEVRKMEVQEKQLSSILGAINMLVEFKRGPTPYLDNLNVILPPEIWLTNLNDLRGQVTVQGYSFANTAVARLMKGMEESDQFANVELKEITQAKIGNETLMKFTVQAMTAIGLKIQEEERKRKEAEEAAKAASKPSAKNGAKKEKKE